MCFKVDGEFLTDHCRGLVLEGRWRHGLLTLTGGLPGISTDQAISILEGTHKLIGVNEVELVPEDRESVAAQYKRDFAWLYAGLWNRPAKGLWQPYAVVTCVGLEDVPNDVSSRLNPSRWSNRRILYYADHPKADHCTHLEAGNPLGLAVIWKRVEDAPLWIKSTFSDAEALAEFFRLGRHLQERGPSYDTPTPPPYDFEKKLERIDPSTRPSSGLATRMAQDMGLEGKMVEALQAITGDVEEIEKPEPDKELCSESGYILPNGIFYGCKYMHHSRLASALLKSQFGITVDDPEIEADRRNWLRIQGRIDGGSNIMSPKNRPTKRQEMTLASWCVVHRTPYPEELK